MTAQADDELWSAIADPSRRRVLDLLVSNGDVSASWLAGRVPFSRQAVSKHLVVLEEAGLVSRRKQGREVLYQVEADRLDQATRAMADLAAQWDRRLGTIKRLAEAAHAEAKKSEGLILLSEETVMKEESANADRPTAGATSAPSLPAAVDRAAFQAELDRLRVREKAHTREGDAIAAARRRLPMTEVDASLALIGPNGPLTLLEAFEGRRQLIAYYFMWNPGHPAAEQCEGCTFYTTQVSGAVLPAFPRHYLRGLLQGPYDESIRYRDFMGWDMPWYSAQRLPRRAPGRAPDRLVSPGVLPTGRRPRLRDLLDDPPRRRGHGLQLRAHGPHRLRTPGAVGGLAPRLAATVLQHAD